MKTEYGPDTLTNPFECGIIRLQAILLYGMEGAKNMSQKSLTVGDILIIKDCLEQAKTTASDAEKAVIDEVIEKLKQMEARS